MLLIWTCLKYCCLVKRVNLLYVYFVGYLGIYSSFNKRKWGKRWCMVHENSFECYRTQTSEVCELEFLLHDCVLRRAIEETKSELGLMLMENNREKITIEVNLYLTLYHTIPAFNNP